MRPLFLCLAASLALVGCGNTPKDDGLNAIALGSVRATVQGLFSPPAAPVDPRKTITRATLDSLPIDVQLLVLEKRDAAFVVTNTGQNGDVVQWRTTAIEGFNYKSGVLIATQGLGFDLLNADVDPLIQALARGGGQNLTRIHRRLDGENKIQLQSFVCDVTSMGSETLTIFDRAYPTTHYREDCSGRDMRITNSYWIERSGVVRQSRQWINAERGVLFTQKLGD